jgi:hypothetical protein
MIAPRPRRDPVPDPNEFKFKTDAQVLRIAQAAYFRAESLPARSVARREEWDLFDRAMGALLRRAMSHVLWRIHEMEQAGEEGIPDGHVAETIIGLIDRNGEDIKLPDVDL